MRKTLKNKEGLCIVTRFLFLPKVLRTRSGIRELRWLETSSFRRRYYKRIGAVCNYLEHEDICWEEKNELGSFSPLY